MTLSANEVPNSSRACTGLVLYFSEKRVNWKIS